MKRCSRCILPNTILNIEFDDNGVCNYCHDYKQISYLSEVKLDEILSKIKNQSKYDCVVPISGGKDSTYVLYMTKRIFGLNPIAVNFNNGFQEEQALINMKNACNILNVDFVSISARKEHAKKYVEYYLRSNITPEDNIIQSMCYACRFGVRASVFSIAQKYRVPLIIWGHAPHELTADMEIEAVDQPDNKKVITHGASKRKLYHYLNNVYDGGKFLHKEINTKYRSERSYRLFLSVCNGNRLITAKNLLNINFYRSEIYKFLLRFDFEGIKPPILSRSFLKINDSNIIQIKLFQYVKWDKKSIYDTITTELGWSSPAESTTKLRFDCKLHLFMNYQYYRMFGCSKDAFGYTNMINSEQITREECLEHEENIKNRTPDYLKQLKKMFPKIKL